MTKNPLDCRKAGTKHQKLGVIDENTYRAVVRNISQEGENRITITFRKTARPL